MSSTLPEGDPSQDQLRHRIEQAQANLYYCLNFPSNEEYLALNLAKQGLGGYKSKDSGERANCEKAALIWKLAQQCAQDDTLQDLSTGRLSHQIKEMTTGDSQIMHDTDDHATQSKQDKIESPRLSVSNKKSKISPIMEDIIDLSSDLREPNDVDLRDSEGDSDLILNTFNEQDALSDGEVSHFDQQSDQFTGKSDRVMTGARTHKAKIDDESIYDDSEIDMDDDDSESQDVDAMVDYSNSEQAVVDADARSKSTDNPPPHRAHILAELSSMDLNIQLRYFHGTRSNKEVDPNTLVRCVVCGERGHMGEACSSLSCDVCGAYNNHVTQDCPSAAKCEKCREMGHDKVHCPYKLKNMALNEIVCDLCLRNGHVEQDCELVWRTSGRPWEFDLTKENVRLSCYECARSGHVGNDCPTRRPRKPLGSSTWGSGKDQISIKSNSELRIKGSARQDAIDLDEDDDAMDRSFVRPKVPEPRRKPKFQIKTGPSASFPNQGSSGWNPINGAPKQPKDQQRDQYHGRWNATNSPNVPGRYSSHGYNGYRPDDRRSVSPQYRDRDGYARSDRYQRPAPQPASQNRRPPPANNTYRPMPSSAQNAWGKYRM